MEDRRVQIERIVALALAEDLAEAGDITSQAIFYAGGMGAARVITRQSCTVSGLDAAAAVCRQVDRDLSWLPLVEDGQGIPEGAEIGRFEGKLTSILAAERTLLNFLTRLSGIATLAARYMEALDGLGVKVAATRKTSPGMRQLEKQAVVHGGGEPHRIGLYDAVLIKDNHIAAAGSLSGAVAAVRDALGESREIEVEVDTEEQLGEAMKAGVSTVLLDNMSPEEVKRAVEMVAGRLTVEASGRITLENVRAYAETGVDLVSAGALTSSVCAVDLSLEVEG